MKASKRKKEIIEKATDLFYKQGYAGASIRDIVNSVGITNSTVYLYFKSKDEILFQIIIDIGSALLEELQAAIDTNEDPLECLQDMIFRQVCLFKNKKKEIKIYLEEQYQLPPKLRKKALKQHRQIYNIYLNMIRKLKDKGLVRDINETIMTFSIFAMMNWSYRWFRNEGKLTIEEVAEDIKKVFFMGILKGSALYLG